MSDSEKPAGQPVDHQLTLDSSRLTRSQSEETVERAKTALKLSRIRLRRSAERIDGTSAETPSLGVPTPEAED